MTAEEEAILLKLKEILMRPEKFNKIRRKPM
jgi:hypothetical protein